MRQCYWHVRQHITLGQNSTDATIALGRIIYGDRAWNWRGDQNKLMELFVAMQDVKYAKIIRLIALLEEARTHGPGCRAAHSRDIPSYVVHLSEYIDKAKSIARYLLSTQQ